MEKAEKIDIRDLSIGDYVRVRMCKLDYNDPDTLDAKVLSIEGNSVGVGYDNSGIVMSAFVEDLQPIPITAEVLERNGLEYEDDGNDAVIFLCCDMFWARLCVGDTFWRVGIHSEDRLEAVVCNVKHIHELQHALRLASVGKEIVL
jgi:hypothetical protein